MQTRDNVRMNRDGVDLDLTGLTFGVVGETAGGGQVSSLRSCVDKAQVEMGGYVINTE